MKERRGQGRDYSRGQVFEGTGELNFKLYFFAILFKINQKKS